MATVSTSPYDYQPTFLEKVLGWIKKQAPYALAHFIRAVMHGIFLATRLILQMFKDATGK